MNKFLKLLILFLCFFTFSTNAKNIKVINGLKILTDEYPPFTYKEKGELKGIAVEILDFMLKDISSILNLSNVDFFYWTDAVDFVSRVPNSMLFVMTRTKERENVYKWVGPVAPLRQVIFAKKGSGIEIESYKDLKKYKIGVVKDFASSTALLSNGIHLKNLVFSYTEKENLFRLYRDEIKLVAADISNFGQYKNAIFLPDDLEEVFVMNEYYLYYAFNYDTSDEIVNAFQFSFDKLKKKGIIKNINDKYLR
ncbi:MAG: Membrane-bound lytic murein transglycosylase F [Alphaproteobacteria bacterium ADurb.Bin438]|nr:MAG: Membrane-bound lytic murein transglycosylase F [Alphaproteobacteria bacterium ADurb.Bin438]